MNPSKEECNIPETDIIGGYWGFYMGFWQVPRKKYTKSDCLGLRHAEATAGLLFVPSCRV
jgi:hypothetical protein